MNILRRIQDQASLAMVYADDGALHSAARVLRELADEVEQRAVLADKFLEEMVAQGNAQRDDGKAGA